MKVELLTFGASEAQRITGVSAATQRDWRRRGFLRSHKGHARHHAGDLAAMLLMNRLGEMGFGPSFLAKEMSQISKHVVQHALEEDGAIVGDWNKYKSVREIPIPHDISDFPHIKRSLSKAKDEGDFDKLRKLELIYSNEYRIKKTTQGHALIECFKENFDKSFNPEFSGSEYNFYEYAVFDIYITQNEISFVTGPDQWLGKADSDPENASIAVFVSLSAIAKQMLNRAGPIAHLNDDAE